MRLLQSVAIVLSLIPIALRIRAWRCDAVYTNTICTCVGAIAARILRIPHVWHIHEFGFEDHGLGFYFGERFSVRAMERLSCLCIANSHAVARKFSKYISPSKLTVVYQSVTFANGDLTEPSRTLFAEESPGLVCIMVGTLHERKGHAEAIRAIAEVRNECGAHLLIVGSGDARYVRSLRRLIRDCELEDRVRFVGYDENPARLVAGADLLLVCSRAEAFGRVTVEAMMLGKPVIGAKSGGTVELIQDGTNGFLYTPGDYKELGERILFLERHPDRRRAMGDTARIWAAQRFTKRRYGEALLRELVARNI